MSRVVVAWGRFNPPTIGHEKLIEAVARLAKRDDYFIYPSHTQKKPTDPLPSDKKVEYMKLMFPKHADHIIYDKNVNTIIKLLQKYQGTYEDLTLIAGSDRVSEYESLIIKYNGVEYSYRNLDVVSAGERDPDAAGASGMSASKMREAAKDLKTTEFKSGIPNTLTVSQKLELMKEVRIGMGLK
jgi:nicotinic acid mononucleotide adenylyltransferase